jgi:hypothetical protein
MLTSPKVDLVFPPPKPRSKFALFNFKPQQPPSDPVSDLVEVFFGTLPVVIKKYFKARPGEPHHLVLFPTNNVLSDEAKHNHTHIIVLKSLKVVSSTAPTVCAVAPPSDVPTEMWEALSPDRQL